MFHIFGDTIVDTYIFGTSTRKSPESDCIVFDEQYKRSYAGGALNVVANLCNMNVPDMTYYSRLGSDKPEFPMPIVPDNFAQKVKDYLRWHEIHDSTVLIKDEKTIEKIRFYLNEKNILRHDREILNKSKHVVLDNLQFSPDDIIIIADYNKGFMTQHLADELLSQKVKAIIIDTKSKINYSSHKKNVWWTPNKAEYSNMTHNLIWNTLLTKSEEGIILKTGDDYYASPSKATEVKDVCGAGDTVTAALAVGIQLGLDPQNLIDFCNDKAAGAIKEFGTSGMGTLI